ncbi:hypothetical protein OAX11_03595 [Flavobacteriaceae bacterium]|nr:hypothetical protein [Flavobacteriaceae bacterium]
MRQQFFLEKELVQASTSNFIQILNTEISNQGVGSVKFNNQRFISHYMLKKWGGYNVLKIKTIHKKDTLQKVALVGIKNNNKKIALYISDLDKPLSIGGNTKIIGDIKISKYGVKAAYINNSNSIRGKLVNGSIGISEKKLPKLEESSFYLDVGLKKEFFLEDIESEILYNSFYKPTIIVNANGRNEIGNVSLSGNIILQSKDSIFIKKTANLSDIIIDAPKIVFERDFKGSLQVYAKDKVILKKGVELQYPSSIFINNDSEYKVEVLLEENSKLAGGIVLTGNSYKSSLNRMITIENNATVVGDVYCYGKIQLKGKVIGSVYTDRFYLKTASSIYENYIIGGEINSLDLPSNYISLPIFPGKNKNYELIKEL